MARKGFYGWAPQMPYTLGMEAYGSIEAIGDSVSARAIGDKVIIGTQYGCYAEKFVGHWQATTPAIKQFTPKENAAFFVNYSTAWVGLFEMAKLVAGESVLIQAAAGGVGTAAVQMAKALGCTVYGTVSNLAKAKLLQDLGIDHAINYLDEDFEESVKKLTDGQGVDVVQEMVGGDVFKKSVRVLKPLGRIIVMGYASMDLKKWNPLSWYKTWQGIPKADLMDMSKRVYSMMAFHLGYLMKDEVIMDRVIQGLSKFVIKHNLRPVVGQSFFFDEIPKAHELMESRKSMGKIVITV
jgi:NADPH2:quinone reductase